MQISDTRLHLPKNKNPNIYCSEGSLCYPGFICLFTSLSGHLQFYLSFSIAQLPFARSMNLIKAIHVISLVYTYASNTDAWKMYAIIFAKIDPFLLI